MSSLGLVDAEHASIFVYYRAAVGYASSTAMLDVTPALDVGGLRLQRLVFLVERPQVLLALRSHELT